MRFLVNTPAVLIMAAGRGTRMRSRLPKVLHPLCGRPMLLWTVHAAREAGAERIVVVLGEEANEVRGVLPPEVEVAIQDPPAGTGDAVAQGRAALAGFEHVIVLSGDHPLLDSSFITALAERHVSSGAAATVTTRVLDDPGQYGRVVRGADGDIERIVETKNPGDATPEEIAIKEINAGTYAFAVEPLFEALAGVRADNSQGEYYLGDVLPLLRARGHGVVAHLTEDEAVGLGVNTRADLAVVEAAARGHRWNSTCSRESRSWTPARPSSTRA
jgi:bifunctional UDP-N-acetylglucosamine pyrophosphorylase/glucosamine-1-phosphate N-acetyltransferase